MCTRMRQSLSSYGHDHALKGTQCAGCADNHDSEDQKNFKSFCWLNKRAIYAQCPRDLSLKSALSPLSNLIR